MIDDNTRNEITNTVKNDLANFLGVDLEDIENSDSFSDDLHMRPSDLTDFLETLSNKLPRISSIDISEIESVGELIDELAN